MKVACLMPTFGRYPHLKYLVEEAVECFLRQDYPDCILMIHNDCPVQRLVFNHPRVHVFNTGRFDSLSSKLIFMIDEAKKLGATAFCRWDDDDLSMPWRLSLSVKKLLENPGRVEWRCDAHYYDPGHLAKLTYSPGNEHVHSIFTDKCLDMIGGYPPNLSGYEDQTFNQALDKHNQPKPERIPRDQVYYFYRWATGGNHLSGPGGNSENLIAHYKRIGTYNHAPGEWTIEPRWYENHVERLRVAAASTRPELGGKGRLITHVDVPNYFTYSGLYDLAVSRTPLGGRLVEVGCYYGASLIYLANKARAKGQRLSVVGIDLGVGAQLDPAPRSGAFKHTGSLLGNVIAAGVQDIVTVIAGESTRGLSLLADNSIDFLFLDADHTKHSVLTEIQVGMPKLKKGGMMAGHDYGNKDFPEVMEAVDDYFGCKQGGMNAPEGQHCWKYIKT